MVGDNDEAIDPVKWKGVGTSSPETITAFTRKGK